MHASLASAGFQDQLCLILIPELTCHLPSSSSSLSLPIFSPALALGFSLRLSHQDRRQRAQVQRDANVKRDEEATGVRGEEVFLVGALGPELPW